MSTRWFLVCILVAYQLASARFIHSDDDESQDDTQKINTDGSSTDLLDQDAPNRKSIPIFYVKKNSHFNRYLKNLEKNHDSILDAVSKVKRNPDRYQDIKVLKLKGFNNEPQDYFEADDRKVKVVSLSKLKESALNELLNRAKVAKQKEENTAALHKILNRHDTETKKYVHFVQDSKPKLLNVAKLQNSDLVELFNLHSDKNKPMDHLVHFINTAIENDSKYPMTNFATTNTPARTLASPLDASEIVYKNIQNNLDSLADLAKSKLTKKPKVEIIHLNQLNKKQIDDFYKVLQNLEATKNKTKALETNNKLNESINDPGVKQILEHFKNADLEGVTVEDLYKTIGELKFRYQLEREHRDTKDSELIMDQLFDNNVKTLDPSLDEDNVFPMVINLTEFEEMLKINAEYRRQKQEKYKSLGKIFDKNGIYYITKPDPSAYHGFRYLMAKLIWKKTMNLNTTDKNILRIRDEPFTPEELAQIEILRNASKHEPKYVGTKDEDVGDDVGTDPDGIDLPALRHGTTQKHTSPLNGILRIGEEALKNQLREEKIYNFADLVI